MTISIQELLCSIAYMEQLRAGLVDESQDSAEKARTFLHEAIDGSDCEHLLFLLGGVQKIYESHLENEQTKGE